MPELLLLQGNPKKRRSRKHRSAAQKAATRRLVSLNRARRNPSKRKTRRKAASSAAPFAVTRRRARRSRRSSTRSVSRQSFGSIKTAAMPMLKNGAIGGAGAVVIDVGMGYLANVLPASMTSKLNADGSTNFMYYGSKALLAIAVGVFGKRIIPGHAAAKMGEGSLTVMSYELLRGFMPASIPMGYVAPARVMGKVLPTQRPGAQMARVLSFNQNMNQNTNARISAPIRRASSNGNY